MPENPPPNNAFPVRHQAGDGEAAGDGEGLMYYVFCIFVCINAPTGIQNMHPRRVEPSHGGISASAHSLDGKGVERRTTRRKTEGNIFPGGVLSSVSAISMCMQFLHFTVYLAFVQDFFAHRA